MNLRISSSSVAATFSTWTWTRCWEALYSAASSSSVWFCLAMRECHTTTLTGWVAWSRAASGHSGSAGASVEPELDELLHSTAGGQQERPNDHDDGEGPTGGSGDDRDGTC